VQLQDVSILQQLRWEEALLRCDSRSWCLINHGTTPAIVMGISGQLEQLVCLNRLRRDPLPIIRRFSGGGTVVVDEQTLFSTFICNADALPIQPYPRDIMRWTERFYQPVFSEQPFAMRENDFVIGERKFGGNAQSIIKGRWLHHSSLLWDYNSTLMDYLTLPAKRPNYRQDRPHCSFLCKLSDYFDQLDAVKSKVVESLSAHFKVFHSTIEELDRIANTPHRMSTQLINAGLTH